jgi:hypothetical protein
MQALTLDVGVLAVPTPECTPNDVRLYVERLLEWKKFIDDCWIPTSLTARAAELLINSNLYPMRVPLARLLKENAINDFDSNTVAMVFDTLLASVSKFEEDFLINDVLITDCVLEPRPDLTPDALHSELERMSAIVAILRTCCNPGIELALAGKNWQTTQSVTVSAQIHEIDHVRDDLSSLPMAPAQFGGSIVVYALPSRLILAFDEVSLWEQRGDALGLVLALKLVVFRGRTARGVIADWSSGADGVRIGRRFVSSTADKGRPVRKKILRAMAETIDQIALGQVHVLRKGLGPEEPQIKRGGDAANRRVIDDEYRLHYWRCSDGTIEFASVVVHNDFSIPF